MASVPMSGGLPGVFMNSGSSSFADFLGAYRPELLPGNRVVQGGAGQLDVPHATTIVAVTFPGGVVMAGDRRATAGNVIAQRDIEKVFPADEYSAVGIAGTAGIAVELVKLFQLELEHFEKVEGTQLSLEGKATVNTDPEAIRDAELRYAQRYRTPRPNPKRVVIEVRVQRVLGSSGLLIRE